MAHQPGDGAWISRGTIHLLYPNDHCDSSLPNGDIRYVKFQRNILPSANYEG